MGHGKNSQCNRLLAYLERGQTINPLDAWRLLGIYRLASRINDLKKLGYEFEVTMIKVGNQFGETCRVASYKLVPKRGQLELGL
jgi:hypothetical protein